MTIILLKVKTSTATAHFQVNQETGIAICVVSSNYKEFPLGSKLPLNLLKIMAMVGDAIVSEI